MKIITESKYINLINPSIRRRVVEKDFDQLDSIIWNKAVLRGYYLMNNFDLYLNSVLSDSIDTFGVNKFRVFGNENINDYLNKRTEFINMFKELIPFLKKKYQDKLYDFYNEINHL